MIIKIIAEWLSAIIIFSAFGWSEAWYYHIRNKTWRTIDYPNNFKEKTILNIIRTCFLVVYAFAFGLDEMVAMIFLFPLIHDGVYYVARHYFDKRQYPKGFWDFGNSAPEGIDLNARDRIILAVAGLAVYFTKVVTHIIELIT